MWRLFISTSCLMFFGIHAGVLTGKGYFCKDPDTGHLYSVNSTWPSTTFCGKYTCKLRKKNITEMEYAPSMKIINVTKANIFGVSEEKNEESDVNPVLHLKDKPNMNALKKILLNNVGHDDDDDRYLTPEEIKTITELLQTVKKSELEAIIEIYNLAQDIYKEIDKTSTNEVLEETLDDVKNNLDFFNSRGIAGGRGRVSYWYEPSVPSESKDKVVDNHVEGTDNHITAVSMIDPHIPHLRNQATITYQPYYHRMAHYHSHPWLQVAPKTPCNKKHHIPSWYKKIARPVYSHQLQPAAMLPYPYTLVSSNNYTYPSYYYDGSNTWGYTNQYVYPLIKTDNKPKVTSEVRKDDKNKNHINAGKDKILNVKAKQSSNEIENISENVKQKKPEWQTDPLPAKIIEEVKAHILEKAKSLKSIHSPMKKIKLEKIGKLLNLDSLKRETSLLSLDRHKRDVTTDEKYNREYEPFIEKIMCNQDSEPGFFRRGDESDVFPNCCPRRIEPEAEVEVSEQTHQPPEQISQDLESTTLFYE